MKNSILNTAYALVTNDSNLNRGEKQFNANLIPFYDSHKIQKIKNIIDDLDEDEYFGYTTLKNTTSIEKMSYDIYNSPNYWDVLILINYKNPLFSMPYDFDIVYDSVEEYLNNYENRVMKRQLTANERERLRTIFMERMSQENEDFRLLRYVYPEKLYDFLQVLRENDVLN